jgi:CNT family concentrative nucleoside transporter
MTQLICLFGLGVFIALAWLIGERRRVFPWRVVIGGLLLQFALAVVVLKTAAGKGFFEWIGAGFAAVMDSVAAGSGFLFKAGDDTTLLQTFAFGVLPTIVFFSSLMSILYHLGVMQRVVGALAWVMRWTLGTSGAETLAAAANIFVGHTEAPLVIRPLLATMTRSELNALMVGGFSTVTGGLLGVYAGMGIDITHLLTASVISAPAALLIAKVMVPETEPDRVLKQVSMFSASQGETASQGGEGVVGEGEDEGDVNLIGAAVRGASDGMKLALNVAAMLIAFLALIALCDTMLATLSRGAGWVVGREFVPLTIGQVLGALFAPLAWLMGVPVAECAEAGRLIGVKTVANEFIAFAELGEIAKGEPGRLSDRTIVVLTYALTGFSNFGAIGIQVGGIGGLAPNRRKELASLGLRAMLGGTLACCMTGAIAGLVIG